MASAATAEAFRRLQSGDIPGALAAARRATRGDPRDARAHLALGLALRFAGDLAASREALERARVVDPRDPAAACESAVACQMLGLAAEARARYEEALRLRAGFVPALFGLGTVLLEAQSWQGAVEAFRAVLAAQPKNPDALLNLSQCLLAMGELEGAAAACREALSAAPGHPDAPRIAIDIGRRSAAGGDFATAATLFTHALRQRPDDPDLPMFVAQCELLEGRWDAGWAAYARRDARLAFERAEQARGVAYRVPSLAEISGQPVELVSEQGLGDILFFLRFAAALRGRASRLAFAGDARLHTLLARTGLFDAFSSQPSPGDAVPILVADLPRVVGDPFMPSLSIAPDPARLARWRERLSAAGPGPYLGVTWRAGTSAARVAAALSKQVDLATLMTTLAPWPGTVVSLQREPRPGELGEASAALGRAVHDFGDMNDDLEDALALVAALDRHVGVSNTNMHLAAAAGKTAEVLVPFPPEWRWRKTGDSPWFPGFAVHRQAVDGDWAAALAALRASLP